MGLTDKSMLVVGAGEIGKEIIRQALAAGAKVTVWDKNPGPLAGLKGKIIRREVDATSEKAVCEGFDALEQEGGAPDIVVNGAGIFTHLKPMGALDFAGFHAVMENNVNGCFLICSEALRRYKDKLDIVNISSSLSKRPIPTAAAYCASKAAIDSLTRSIALEYAAKGVRANAVNPGPVAGGMLQSGMEEIAAIMQAPPEAILGKILESLAQGRVVTPKEVAELVIFLASDQAASINGQTINICGGHTYS
jgi:hypothetical protein